MVNQSEVPFSRFNDSFCVYGVWQLSISMGSHPSIDDFIGILVFFIVFDCVIFGPWFVNCL